ncbi:hypothetical protein QR680_009386 [Steinernema hermaphroditum]|uniref:CCHC-type domain-containing protein n=1 Tax=Steinernema hermaphroditum TaxID=289476 RepID=A0AA39M8R8_9BILA|nr:hypothetical protein QR680_009386 [Steinernema hermaphroditum]
MSDQVESPQGSEKFDHLFALMEKVAEKVDTLEAKQQQAAVKEKPLKSTRLDVQVQLNAEWINRLNQLAAERSGGGGARTSVAFNYRDNQIASLAAQVQQLQQQTQYAIGGYGAPQQFARRPAQSMCYNCKGYGHLAKQCPQGASSSRQ